MNRGYDALAANWQEQADRYVRKAQKSTSLRDIVRLIAMASTLEHAAQKVTSGVGVDFDEIARIVCLDADQRESGLGPQSRKGVRIMLILSRRLNEVLRISEVIRIHVLGIKGHQVRLGIEAPPEIVVDREEIYLRKQEELKVARAGAEIIKPR